MFDRFLNTALGFGCKTILARLKYKQNYAGDDSIRHSGYSHSTREMVFFLLNCLDKEKTLNAITDAEMKNNCFFYHRPILSLLAF